MILNPPTGEHRFIDTALIRASPSSSSAPNFTHLIPSSSASEFARPRTPSMSTSISSNPAEEDVLNRDEQRCIVSGSDIGPQACHLIPHVKGNSVSDVILLEFFQVLTISSMYNMLPLIVVRITVWIKRLRTSMTLAIR